jgi:hypothetical protein
MPTVLIPNTHKGILDYLTERTADTIGEQVNRSQVIVVGRVRQAESRSIPIRLEDVASLQPWLSGEAGIAPSIDIFLTRVQVERWLVGPSDAEQIEVAYAGPRGTGGAEFFPNFNLRDRGLLFLRKIPPDLPYASYIQDRAYQLAAGEKEIRSFQVTDYDQQGRPYTRDETASVEETIAAVEWYAALPHENLDALRQALSGALDDTNPRVARHAIRSLARLGNPAAAQQFKDRVPNAPEDLRVRLMLGLWILGEEQAAKDLLEEFFQQHGEYPWLAQWAVELTQVEPGKIVDTLYGPDPAELKGD